MKKINILLATLAMLVATVSCNNDDKLFNEHSSADGGLKVDITVADLQPSTKAIKTGWANGDIINVYLDDAASNYVPDFTLTFNGTNWIASEISDAVKNRLKANNGKLSGFWEGSNSCMTDASWSKNGGYIDFPGYGSATGHKGYIVADFQEIPYTISEGILSANISSWRFRSDLQIVVSGISFEDGRYTLCSDGLDNLSSIGVHTYTVEHQCYVSYYGTGYENGRVAGIANADGVAFVGGLSTSYSPGESFKVYLIDNVTGVTYSFTKVFTDYLGSDNSKVIAIKIPFNKFAVDLTKTHYFSVSDTKKIIFAKGNLQYQASTNTWRFAEHQWDYIGEDNANVASDYEGWIDIYGWGTSGYNHGAVCYQPWSTSTTWTDYKAYNDQSKNLYDGDGTADWGYNAISNGGNAENSGWRCLTQDEWKWIYGDGNSPVPGTDCRTSATVSNVANARFARAKLFDATYGVILFPDNYVHPDGVTNPTGVNQKGQYYWDINKYSEADWAKMEAAGAVFFPCGGTRNDQTSVYEKENSMGAYWTSSRNADSETSFNLARYFCVTRWVVGLSGNNRQIGCSVRLALDIK